MLTLRFLNDRLVPGLGMPVRDQHGRLMLEDLAPGRELSSLRQRFLTERSSRNLKRLFYEIEEYLVREPNNVDALMLRDDIRLLLGLVVH